MVWLMVADKILRLEFIFREKFALVIVNWENGR